MERSPSLNREAVVIRASVEHAILNDCLMVGGFNRRNGLETVALKAMPEAKALTDGSTA